MKGAGTSGYRSSFHKSAGTIRSHRPTHSLHTRDAKGAIKRYADLFPQDVQKDVRVQLALSLRAIVSQRLLPALQSGPSAT